MSSNKVAIIGDMHFGIKAGNPDFLAFQIAWLEYMLQKCQEMGITTIVQTGDMLDTRAMIKMNVLDFFLNRFTGLLQKYGITRWIIYGGNHEMYYRDSNEICSLDILKLLGRQDEVYSKVEFEVYTDQIGVMHAKGKNIAFVPWLNKNNDERLMSDLAKMNVDYVFGHFELIGMPMIPGVLCEHGINPSDFKKYKRVISGHFHTVSQYLNCTMVGTPYHLTWGDVQDGNNRGFWTLDVDTDELVIHKNADYMTLFSVIEYDPKMKYDDTSFVAYKGSIAKVLVKDKPDAKHYKKFNEFLAQAGLIDYKTIDTTLVQIDKVEISEEVLHLDTLSAMNTFIDKQQNDEIDKEGLKELTKEIYMEALSGIK